MKNWMKNHKKQCGIILVAALLLGTGTAFGVSALSDEAKTSAKKEYQPEQYTAKANEEAAIQNIEHKSEDAPSEQVEGVVDKSAENKADETTKEPAEKDTTEKKNDTSKKETSSKKDTTPKKENSNGNTSSTTTNKKEPENNSSSSTSNSTSTSSKKEETGCTHSWKPVYTAVDKGHYEQVLVKEAYSEVVTKQKPVWAEICKGCGHAMFNEDDITEHTKGMALAGDYHHGSWYTGRVFVEVTETVNHPAQYKQVWIPNIVKGSVVNYICTKCNQYKFERDMSVFDLYKE